MNCPSCSKKVAGSYEVGSYSCSGCGGQIQVESNPARHKHVAFGKEGADKRWGKSKATSSKKKAKKNPGRKPLQEGDPFVAKAFEFTKAEADDLAKFYRQQGGRARVYKGSLSGKDGYFILWTMANPAKKNPSFEYPPHASPEFPGEGAGYARSQAGGPSYSPGQSATRNPDFGYHKGQAIRAGFNEYEARQKGRTKEADRFRDSRWHEVHEAEVSGPSGNFEPRGMDRPFRTGYALAPNLDGGVMYHNYPAEDWDTWSGRFVEAGEQAKLASKGEWEGLITKKPEYTYRQAKMPYELAKEGEEARVNRALGKDIKEGPSLLDMLDRNHPSYRPMLGTQNPAGNPPKGKASNIPVGTRVGLLPHLDDWMRGDKYGEVVKVGRTKIHVKLDRSGRTKTYSKTDLTLPFGAPYVPPPPHLLGVRDELYRRANPNLTLTEDDVDTIAFVGGRYGWSDALDTYDVGDNDIPEHEAWEIRDAIDSDMEGGHDAFPMLDTRSELAGKLADFYQSIENPVGNPASQELFDSIEFGSRVTIRTSQGQEKTGKAVMKGGGPPPHHSVPHWVLDMGGKFGTPAVALPEDVVKVTKGRGKKRTLGTMRLTGDYRNPPFKEHKLEAKKKHWALEDNPSTTQYSIRIKQQGSGAWAVIRYYDTKAEAEREFAILDAPREWPGAKGVHYMMAIFHGNKKIKQNFYDNPAGSATFGGYDVDEWASIIEKGINAPVVQVKSSALGGKENLALIVRFSLDEKEDWVNGIYENSRWAQIWLRNDGTMEMPYHGLGKGKGMRKTKFKSATDATRKINTWIQKS